MKKILLFTLSPFCTFDNMGLTLTELFKQYDKNKIRQLYIGNLKPDIYNFDSCYQITDYDVIKSLGNKVRGKIISDNKESENEIKQINQSSYEYIKKNNLNFSSIMIYARNLMWKIAKIDESEIMNWIDEFKPEIIFFVLNRYAFTYDLCLKIKNNYNNVKIVTYITDDYYFYYRNNFIGLYSKYQFLLRKKIDKIMQSAEMIISIGDKMKEQYCSYFHLPGYTIFTPYSNISREKMKYMDKSMVSFAFMGNLEFSRHESIIDISKCLLRIEKEKEIKTIIDIYTLTENPNILKALSKQPNIRVNKPIPKDEVNVKLKEYDFALHVESLKKSEIKKTKLSISTKIPDILANANGIIAYGPKEIASIQYLRSISEHIVAEDKDDLYIKIMELIDNEEKKSLLFEKIRTAAQLNHGPSNIDKILKNIDK